MTESNEEQEERNLWEKLTQEKELENATEGTRKMASLIAVFYKQLIEDGVPPEVAADMTNSFIYAQTGR